MEKDGNILNLVYIIDLNFIILQFKFLTRNFDFDEKYDFRFLKNMILRFWPKKYNFNGKLRFCSFGGKTWFYGFDGENAIFTGKYDFFGFCENSILWFW